MVSRSVAATESLLQFPCAFSIKAMGEVPGFADLVVDLIEPYAPGIQSHQVSTRSSRNGRYLSVTVKITAQSREQMDAIYQTLSDHPKVLMAL